MFSEKEHTYEKSKESKKLTLPRKNYAMITIDE